MVLGKLKRPRVGFNIGSGLAPGGASLLASWRESRLSDVQGVREGTLIIIYMKIMRWTDDLWISTVRSPPEEVRLFLRARTEEKFHGDGLKLEGSRDMVPFGFRARVRERGESGARPEVPRAFLPWERNKKMAENSGA